jgi:hypothetical protein
MQVIVIKNNWLDNITYEPGERFKVEKGEDVWVTVFVYDREFQNYMKGDITSVEEFVIRSIYAADHKLGLKDRKD